MFTQKLDRFLFLIGAGLIFISSYQLFLVSRGNYNLAPALGTLSATKAVVKTKNAVALDWQDAFIGNDVAENQLIYTDQNAEAQVKFIYGGELIIGENSLVKIRSIGESRGLNIQRGLIRARLEGREPLLVELNGEEYKLSGEKADVQINLAGKEGEIGVLAGKVRVEKGGLLEDLDSSSSLEIKRKSATKKAIVYQLIQPTRNQRLHTTKDIYPMTFSWAPGDLARIAIAQNASFSGAEIIEGQGSVNINLTPGTYYWRVEGRLGNSLIGQFTLLPEIAPKIIRPIHQEKVVLMKEQEDPELVLQWEGDSLQKYLVEWEDKSIHREIFQGPRAHIKMTESAELKWRVKIENLNRPEALWSEKQIVNVELVAAPDIPTDLFPHEVEFQNYDQSNETVELKWNSSSRVEWEIINPKGEKEGRSVKEGSLNYETSGAGEYRWRVRGIDQFSRTSQWSEWKTFNIIDLSQEAKKEYQRIQLKRPDQQVEFSWKSDEGTISIFELARDEAFSDVIVKQEIKTNQTKFTVPVIGVFYWRSRQFLPDGSMQVSAPKKVIIEPVPQILKPDKLPDVEVPIEWNEPEDKTTSLWEWIIPSAYADEILGTAKINFAANENANSYQIRIFKDADLKELLIEKEIKEASFQWDNVKPGIYYWQYAIIDHWKRKSEFSDASVLKVVAVKIPEAEKPVLLLPTGNRSFDKIDLFSWTASRKNTSYEFQLASDNSFQTLIKTAKTTKGEYYDADLALGPGNYFWRVEASNKWKQKSLSQVAEFSIAGEKKVEEKSSNLVDEVKLSDEKVEVKKVEVKKPIEKEPVVKEVIVHSPQSRGFKNRVSFSYSPSLDSYTFEKSGKKGKIDGQVLNGLSLGGTYFLDTVILNAEILRQSGKVFKGEEYLFQRALVDAVYTKNLSDSHRVGLGVVVGQTSGQEYDLENSKVVAKSISALNYGVMLRGYYAFNESWEIQSSLRYLTGDIKQVEGSAEALRRFEKFYILGGVNFASREYKLNKGEQTSLRINLGLGKEF